MKRTVIALAIGAVGILATAMSSEAQGYVTLDTYNSSGNTVQYLGSGITGGFNVGVYYALGSVSVSSDGTGIADPTTLGAVLLGSGTGSTTATWSTISPGLFTSISPFAVPGSAAGGTATFVIVAYNGASYGASTIRGHSAGFTETLGASSAVPPVALGGYGLVANAMPSFSVFAVAVPEPTTFALAGLGGLSLMLFRRRK